MYRTLRTFSTLGRFSFRSHPLHYHNGAAHIQPVRIVRPILSKRRAQTVLMYALGLAVYLHFVVGSNVEEEEVTKSQPKKRKTKDITTVPNKDGQERGEQGTEEGGLDVTVVPETMPEDAMFIPLGWAKKLPPTVYKGSDPEWQGFVEFSQDRERSLRIRNELAGIVGHSLKYLPAFERALGTPMQTAKFWLDIDFPNGPPPEYERSGLEITEDYIAWTTRPVSAINHSRLQLALWPTSMGLSVWASSAALWSLQMARFKQYFNLKSSSEAHDPNPPKGYIDFRRFAKTTDKQPPEAGPGVHPAPDSKASDSAPAKSTSSSAATGAGRVFPPLPSLPQPGGSLHSAAGAFIRTLAQTWRPAWIPPPRGTFLVSGLVEVRGPLGLCVLDVRAAYHPEFSRWETIDVIVRRVQPLKQAPQGGA